MKFTNLFKSYANTDTKKDNTPKLSKEEDKIITELIEEMTDTDSTPKEVEQVPNFQLEAFTMGVRPAGSNKNRNEARAQRFAERLTEFLSRELGYYKIKGPSIVDPMKGYSDVDPILSRATLEKQWTRSYTSLIHVIAESESLLVSLYCGNKLIGCKPVVLGLSRTPTEWRVEAEPLQDIINGPNFGTLNVLAYLKEGGYYREAYQEHKEQANPYDNLDFVNDNNRRITLSYSADNKRMAPVLAHYTNTTNFTSQKLLDVPNSITTSLIGLDWAGKRAPLGVTKALNESQAVLDLKEAVETLEARYKEVE